MTARFFALCRAAALAPLGAASFAASLTAPLTATLPGTLPAAAIIAAALPAALASPAQAAEPETAAAALKASNFDLFAETMHEMGAALETAPGQAAPPGLAGLWSAHFPPEEIKAELQRSIEVTLSEADAQALIDWTAEGVGARSAASERAFMSLPLEAQEIAQAEAALRVSPARAAILERMIADTYAVDLTLSISRATASAMMRGMFAAQDMGGIQIPPEELDAMISAMIARARPQIEAEAFAAFAASYDALDDADLAAAADFWGGETGRRVIGALFGATRDMMDRRSAALGAAMAEAAKRQEL